LTERDCEFTDGYIDLEDKECQNCSSQIRNLCKIFSIHKGFRDAEYFLNVDKSKPVDKNVGFLNRIKEMRE